jgi:Fe2+ or Zn2+ uptake regulation protein
MSDAAAILDVLDHAGYQLTRPRRAMAEIIASREGRFTAEDLVSEAYRVRPRIGRATVFRSLEIFEALRLVERVHLVRSDHAYVVCDPAHHHHHLVCDSCGRSIEVTDVGIGPIAQAIEERTGYRVDSHRLELFGICPACQGAQTASA